MRFASELTPEHLSRIFGLRIRAKAVLEGALAGWHRSPFHGYSSEFSQYRGYVPGDDTRRLDWKVYGRRDQLVVRQYRDETNASIYLAMDTSASMGHRGGGDFSKLEYGGILAASLALLAERQRDALSLTHGGPGMQEFLPPESGPVRTREVLHRLETLAPGGGTELGELFAGMAARIGNQGFVFLFTDAWQEPGAIAAGLRRVRGKSRSTSLVLLRTPEEMDFFPGGAYRLKDLETGEEVDAESPQSKAAYFEAVRSHLHTIAGECTRLGIRLIQIRTDWPLDASMRKILP